jgi:hypothetical protein
MTKKLLVATFSLAAAGCFFGGESDSDTVTDSGSRGGSVKLITPGAYMADEYASIDSTWVGLESEFILDASGKFQHYFVGENEAWIEWRGNWVQKDSAFYFSKLEETEVDGGLFDNFIPFEDDTNAVMRVTDTSFMRREWTPMRQRPYWITYHRRSIPSLKEGLYRMVTIDSSDSVPVTITNKILMKNDEFTYTFTRGEIDTYQHNAKYRQVGSFLAIEGIRVRQIDSTNTFSAWASVPGTALWRLEAITDHSFRMWNSDNAPFLSFWEDYERIAAE